MVAFSFAGEQRKWVRAIAEAIEQERGDDVAASRVASVPLV